MLKLPRQVILVYVIDCTHSSQGASIVEQMNKVMDEMPNKVGSFRRDGVNFTSSSGAVLIQVNGEYSFKHVPERYGNVLECQMAKYLSLDTKPVT